MIADFSQRIAAATFATLHATDEIQRLLTSEIAAMTSAWQPATTTADELAAQADALSAYAEAYGDELETLWRAHPKTRPEASSHSSTTEADPLVRRPHGGWTVSERVTNVLDGHLRAAYAARREGSQRMLSRRFEKEAQRETAAALGIVRALQSDAKDLTSQREALLARRYQEAEALRAAADERLAEAGGRLSEAMRRLPPGMAPWSAPSWFSWSPVFSHRLVLLGMLRAQLSAGAGPNADVGRGVLTPHFVSMRDALHVSHPRSQRPLALGLARSLLLRTLASTPPGKLRVSVFDPTGLGQSVASILELGEYDRDLIGGKVWSSTDDLRRVLAEHTGHVELVIQKYLRAEYDTLDEFNAAAGEIAEPYRLLVVLDAPAGFDERCSSDLRRIIENGPRCGVATLLLSDDDTPAPYGVSLDELPAGLARIRLQAPFRGVGNDNSLLFDLEPETDDRAPEPVLESIVSQVGRAAQASTISAVSFERTFGLFGQAALEGRKRGLPRLTRGVDVSDPATWWSQSTLESVAAPVGLRGARDAATLMFDSSDHAGALLVGRPGSGKSTLLHTFIGGITTLYGPGELELHLIDFKEGVEFKVYAAQALPHARTVAIESDREFGVSVLQAIQAELSYRGSLLRGSSESHSSLQALRTATGERLPRIVLIVDEFQVLFARNDKLGNSAADLLETLIRQGRGFGIHVLLGSQSLAGLDALGSHVPQLLPVRILLPAADSDAFKVLGEGNTEGSALTSAGEGILNPSGGAVEANERFRGAVVSEDDRRERVTAMRTKADAEGFRRRPFVFEGSAPLPAEDTPPARFTDEIRGADARALRLRFGAPMALAGTADIDLRRESGANVILVARDTVAGVDALDSFSVPRAVTANLVLSALARRATVELVDFLPIDEGLEELAAPLLSASAITLSRRRQVPHLLRRVSEEVQRRVGEDDTSSPPVLLVLFGMHRARDFDQDSVDYDATADLADRLARIMRDGPEVGVHTALWFDTVGAIARRLPSSAVREASWRLAGRMSADDSSSFVGVESANSLREQQLLAVNDDRGVLQRCTSISQPGTPWVREFLDVVADKPAGPVQ